MEGCVDKWNPLHTEITTELSINSLQLFNMFFLLGPFSYRLNYRSHFVIAALGSDGTTGWKGGWCHFANSQVSSTLVKG